jgi:hypothetical protein
MILVLSVALLACAFGLASSMLFNWTSSKSPLWNIGFFIGLVVVSAFLLLLAIVLLSRRLSS